MKIDVRIIFKIDRMYKNYVRKPVQNINFFVCGGTFILKKEY